MINNGYVVSIGGTGARCVESLVHLCAMGMGPAKITILFVDPDKANYSIDRATTVIRQYNECRVSLGLPIRDPAGVSVPMFATEISLCVDARGDGPAYSWSPVGRENTLLDYLEYHNLPPPQRKLCDLLCKRREMELEWDIGFSGRPAIGAPVMASVATALDEAPWLEFVRLIKDTLSREEARVFLFSTEFGATGASGFPTFSTILRRASVESGWPHQGRFVLGGAPLLPYFGFPPPKDDAEKRRLHANPENFLINSKAALAYYRDAWKKDCPLNALYFIGDDTLDERGRTFSDGGSTQCNATHYVELLAALGARHFYSYEQFAGKGLHQFTAGREAASTDSSVVTWRDLPTLDKAKMLYFTSTVVSYMAFYRPLINGDAFRKRPVLAPWAMDAFRPAELRAEEAVEGMTRAKDYFVSYLRWVMDIHSSTTRDVQVFSKAVWDSLVTWSAVRDAGGPDALSIGDELFCGLLDPRSSRYDPCVRGYNQLWETMCDLEAATGISLSDLKSMLHPSGRLLAMLYTANMRFCDHNYQLKADEEA